MLNILFVFSWPSMFLQKMLKLDGSLRCDFTFVQVEFSLSLITMLCFRSVLVYTQNPLGNGLKNILFRDVSAAP